MEYLEKMKIARPLPSIPHLIGLNQQHPIRLRETVTAVLTTSPFSAPKSSLSRLCIRPLFPYGTLAYPKRYKTYGQESILFRLQFSCQ
jgi:hypothetical protein